MSGVDSRKAPKPSLNSRIPPTGTALSPNLKAWGLCCVVAVTLYAVPSQNASGQTSVFGIRQAMTMDSVTAFSRLEPYPAPGYYRLLDPPSPVGFFEGYEIVLGSNGRICKAIGIGRTITVGENPEPLFRQFDSVATWASQVLSVAGTTLIDTLGRTPGTPVPTDLGLGRIRLSALWIDPPNAVQNGGFTVALLVARAQSPSEVFLTIEVSFQLSDGC